MEVVLETHMEILRVTIDNLRMILGLKIKKTRYKLQRRIMLKRHRQILILNCNQILRRMLNSAEVLLRKNRSKNQSLKKIKKMQAASSSDY